METKLKYDRAIRPYNQRIGFNAQLAVRDCMDYLLVCRDTTQLFQHRPRLPIA
jgi:hypothetical protein